MNSITQKIIYNCLKTISLKEIKVIVVRKRLRFSYHDISFYLYCIFVHGHEQKSFKSIYQSLNKIHSIMTYQNFMKNITLLSPLMKRLFVQFNDIHHIKVSRLLNIVDSTLMEEKSSQFIKQKDWNLNRVTTRLNQPKGKDQSSPKDKKHICGSKGLFFINRFNQIYHAQFLNINDSDQNVLKSAYSMPSKIQGILLADRGFTSKIVRDRFSQHKNDIFNQTKIMARLISPYHYKEKLILTPKELKLYKRRWKIETLFQRLKYHYSDNKLNLKGKYSTTIKQAKFYATLISHNLSTIK